MSAERNKITWVGAVVGGIIGILAVLMSEYRSENHTAILPGYNYGEFERAVNQRVAENPTVAIIGSMAIGALIGNYVGREKKS